MATLDLDLEIISISKKRRGKGIANRDPVKTRREDKKLVVIIPDGQSDSRWYSFELK